MRDSVPIFRCRGNLKFCQGIVREVCFRWSVATLYGKTKMQIAVQGSPYANR